MASLNGEYNDKGNNMSDNIVTAEMMGGSKDKPAQLEGDLVVVGNKHPIKVLVTDIDMPFMSMVNFMVKWAIAAIPALIILIVLGAVLSGAISGLLLHR